MISQSQVVSCTSSFGLIPHLGVQRGDPGKEGGEEASEGGEGGSRGGDQAGSRS